MSAVSQQPIGTRISLLRGIPLRFRPWLSQKGLHRDFWIFFAAALCFDFGFSVFFFLYNLFLL